MKRIFWLAGIIVVAGIVWWAARGGSANDSKSTAPTTAKVARRDIDVTVAAVGEINPGNQVSVKPEVSGRIHRLAVQTGQTVAKGELLEIGRAHV